MGCAAVTKDSQIFYGTHPCVIDDRDKLQISSTPMDDLLNKACIGVHIKSRSEDAAGQYKEVHVNVFFTLDAAMQVIKDLHKAIDRFL